MRRGPLLILLPLMGCVEQNPCFNLAGSADQCAGLDTAGDTETTGSTDTETDAGESTTGSDDGSESETAGDETGCIDGCDWWDEDWAHRTCMTLDNSSQSSALTDFPVLLHLDPAQIQYEDAHAEGDDLRIIDADGTTELSFDVDEWEPGGRSALWVRVPTVQAGARAYPICLYYGNPSAAASQSPADTWTGPHHAVWHLSPDLRDATDFEHDLIDFGSTPTDGFVGEARAFAGEGASVYGPIEPGLQIHGDLTVSAWVRFDSLASGPYANLIATVGEGGESSAANYPWWLSLDDDGTMRAYWEYGEGVDVDLTSTAPVAVLDTQWHQYALVRDSESMELRFYFDGTMVGDPVPYLIEPDGGEDTWPTVGADAYDPTAYYVDGAVDEVRITSQARSTDWIRAQYSSETDAMVSFGSIE